MVQRYAIGSLDEARAYLRHPVLGSRLRTCTATVNRVTGRSAHEIFGVPDDAKFRSSMTPVALADAELMEFRIALTHFFDSEEDPRTRAKLGLSRGWRSGPRYLRHIVYGLWHARGLKKDGNTRPKTAEFLHFYGNYVPKMSTAVRPLPHPARHLRSSSSGRRRPLELHCA